MKSEAIISLILAAAAYVLTFYMAWRDEREQEKEIHEMENPVQ